MTSGQATSRRAAVRLSLQRINSVCSEIWLLFSVLCGVFLLIALYTFNPADAGWSHAATPMTTVANGAGTVGAWCADVILNLFGYPGYLAPLVLVCCCWYVSRFRFSLLYYADIGLRVSGMILLLLGSCALAEVYYEYRSILPVGSGGGGILGSFLSAILLEPVGVTGFSLLMLMALASGIALAFNISWQSVAIGLGEILCAAADYIWRQRLLPAYQSVAVWGEGRLRNLRNWRSAPATSAVAAGASSQFEGAREPALHSGTNSPAVSSLANPSSPAVEPVVGSVRVSDLHDAAAMDKVVGLSARDEEPSMSLSFDEQMKLQEEADRPSGSADYDEYKLNATDPGSGAAVDTVASIDEMVPPCAAADDPADEEQPSEQDSVVRQRRRPGIPLPGCGEHELEQELPEQQAVEYDQYNQSVAAGQDEDMTLPPPLSAADIQSDDEDVADDINTEVSEEQSEHTSNSTIVPDGVETEWNVTMDDIEPPAPDTTILPEGVETEVRVVIETDGDSDSDTRGARPALPVIDLPPLSLLSQVAIGSTGFDEGTVRNMAQLVEQRLGDFGVKCKVAGVMPGPVITCFELELAPGIKGSRVTNLARDLARALSVVSVRVVEIIPGKSVLGLEVPNARRETVNLREILANDSFAQSEFALPIALGKDISGVPSVVGLDRMPHLLVAGTTGSGKSVALNAMILSILYRATAQQVRMIMIDPKMLELSVYQNIPHLLAPVVTDMKEASNALKWCVAEMERRYQVLAASGVRNIAGYHRKRNNSDEDIPDMPYVVVVIDELADMMMVTGKKVEEQIARLAQKARAAGIHLILATQRPSVDVITGLIKANIPSRISFQVSSRIDSRTILDQMGAESLLGHGDMLYLPVGAPVPSRLHGAFVDDGEVHRVADWLREASGGVTEYIDDVVQEKEEELADSESKGSTEEQQDPLYEEAKAMVVESQRPTISYVQRRMRIGYNRAARLLEEMEAQGVVSAPENNGNREVLQQPGTSI